MSETVFTIKPTNLKTLTVGELQDCVRTVGFDYSGERQGERFGVFQQVTLPDAAAESFIPFDQIDEATVIGWVEQHFANAAAVKNHIDMILDRMIIEAQAKDKPLPWASPVTPEAEGGTQGA